MTIPIDATLGTHVIRAKAIDTSLGGDILNPCTDFDYGEVHDYSVTSIDTSLSVPEIDLDNSEFSITSYPNNQFEIILETSLNEKLIFSVSTITGQLLSYTIIEKGNPSAYNYELDMSYVSSGAYIVNIGNERVFKTGKSIVT